MYTLLVELWEGGKQVAEFDLSELNHLTNEQADNFWKIQSDLNRSVMLRYKDSTPSLKGTLRAAQGLGDCHNAVAPGESQTRS